MAGAKSFTDCEAPRRYRARPTRSLPLAVLGRRGAVLGAPEERAAVRVEADGEWARGGLDDEVLAPLGEVERDELRLAALEVDRHLEREHVGLAGLPLLERDRRALALVGRVPRDVDDGRARTVDPVGEEALEPGLRRGLLECL